MNCLAHLLLIVTLKSAVLGFPNYQTIIPNGNNVRHPCSQSETWGGVGHEYAEGQGPLNPFGRAFLANNKQWTTALCRADSDGDGKTNGEELGDPNCSWQPGNPNPPANNVSHPGICDPITSMSCRSKNKFLEDMDACQKVLNITKKPWCPAINDPSVKSIELRFNRTVLSSNETIYLCQLFPVPSDQEYHVIAWEPIVDNHELMHHLVLITCPTKEEEESLTKAKRFLTPDTCGMTTPTCKGGSGVVWAYGQPNRCYSAESGMLMGNGSFGAVVLQIHYNNPFHLANVSVASGLRLHYTPKKRSYDTSMINFGQYDFAVPPRSKSYKVSAVAFDDTNCSNSLLANGNNGTQKYYMTSMLFHMHKMGVHAKLLIRKSSGKVVTIVDEDVTYDRPKFLVWSNSSDAPTIEAGDNFEIECIFQSLEKSGYTYFGESTADEMCMVFFEIFPRPLNMNFVSLFTMGDTAPQCMWDFGKKNVSQFDSSVHGCQIIPFGGMIQFLAANTTFLGDCLGHEYPATTCSSTCGKLLDSFNLTTNNPCLDDSVLRFLTAFTVTPTFEQAYYLASEVNLCARQHSTRELASTNGGIPGTQLQATVAVSITLLITLAHL